MIQDVCGVDTSLQQPAAQNGNPTYTLSGIKHSYFSAITPDKV